MMPADFTEADRRHMQTALQLAERAATHGDVPIGAVVARGDEVLGSAGNERELRGDPTAHAEVLALRQASERLGGWRLLETTIYVTLEPCPM
ncbi:MAG: nucleoside deaminase, partial [Solirubrobacterales bacterium]